MEPTTAAVVSIVSKPIRKISESFFAPLLDAACNAVGVRSKTLAHKLSGGYESYLSNACERHSYLTSIVLRNSQKKLLDYYIPLTLVRGQKGENLQINSFPSGELEEVKRMLIVDTAGMGKTTLLKVMFLYCVDGIAGIPVFIELRKLNKKITLIDFILSQLTGLNENSHRSVVLKMIDEGGFIFFLDGYDEISESDREIVTRDLQAVVEKAPKNKFIMTSREEVGLVSFPSFQRYTIRPLVKSEAYALLRKYASGSPVAEELIAKLKQPAFVRVQEFLRNPLLTSLLYKSFEYKNVIPLQRHIFYRQVYEALFLDHDISKEGGGFVRQKRSGVDMDRFEKILRSFGANTYKRGLEYSRSEVVELLEKSLIRAGERKVAPSDVLHDLTHAVPLLVEDGIQLRWSHRSIQEYFAALDLCLSDPTKLGNRLVSLFKENEGIHHLNLILLCSGIDLQTFNRSIGCMIASSLLDEYDAMFPNGVDGVGVGDVNARRACCVGRDLFILSGKKEILNREEHDAVGELHEEMLQSTIRRAVRRPIGGSISFSGALGFGTIRTMESQIMEEFAANGEWPFLVARQSQVRRISESVFPNIDFGAKPVAIPLNDDCGSPLNTAEAFADVNNVLRSWVDWEFDPEGARRFIEDMNREPSCDQSRNPWD